MGHVHRRWTSFFYVSCSLFLFGLIENEERRGKSSLKSGRVDCQERSNSQIKMVLISTFFMGNMPFCAKCTLSYHIWPHESDPLWIFIVDANIPKTQRICKRSYICTDCLQRCNYSGFNSFRILLR